MRYRAPPFNHDILLFFFRVRLCSHTTYLLQVTWTDGSRWIPSGRRRSRGPESTWSLIWHVHEIYFKRWRSKGVPDDTWRCKDRPISIAIGTWSWSDLQQIFSGRSRYFMIRGTIKRDHGSLWGKIKAMIITLIVAINSTPRPHQTARNFGPKFFLKSDVFSLWKLTFDRFLK